MVACLARWKAVGEIVGEIVLAAGRTIGAAARRAARHGAARARPWRIICICIGVGIIVAVFAGAGAPLAGLPVLAAGPLGRRLLRAGGAVGGGRRAQAAAWRVTHIAAHRMVRLRCLKGLLSLPPAARIVQRQPPACDARCMHVYVYVFRAADMLLPVCAWREMIQAEVPKLASCRAMPIGS